MKKIHILEKTLKQIILYLFELLAVSFCITSLTNYLEPITTYMVFLERMLLSYTIYQIMVVVILTNINDIQKDAYLAWITTLKFCLLYKESHSNELKTILLQKIHDQLKKSTFNTLSFREGYENLLKNLDSLTMVQIQAELINAEHCYEMVSLNWRYSFILRLPIFK